MTSSTLKNKPLKWTTQRANNNTNFKSSSHRVHKRSTTSTRNNNNNNNSNPNTAAAAIMTAEIKTDPREEIERLQNELEFTYDTVATITVHFESLHHAYMCSKPELDKSKNSTRLGEMEKELLTAYDDLGLQVTHLERKIAKLEKRLVQLRQLELTYVAPVTQENQVPSSIEEVVVVIEEEEEEASLFVKDEINSTAFMSSPCSSVDSSIADYQQQPESNYFYDDWTLSQIMNQHEEQPIMYNDCNQIMLNYPDLSVSSTGYYQELCNLPTIDMYNTSYISYPQFTTMQ
ncbi:hypothetical protein BD770DRAFT_385420 [Pilaira anomala]|nr:hypothetical protein BD770DRAFT_385420 [Pilaira anomala]